MSRKAIKLDLKPGTQFHIGRTVPFMNSVLHDTDTIIHSDTLFSALVNIAAKVGIERSVINAFENEITISSVFYLLEKNNSYVYFMPKPTLPLDTNLPVKEIKKIKHLSVGVLTQYGYSDWFVNGVLSDKLVKGNNWIATKEEIKQLFLVEDSNVEQIKLYHIDNIPQVKVHSDTKDDNFYQNANMQIADNRPIDPELEVNFYCLVEGELSKEILTVLCMLEDEGIGGQRSTGCGVIQNVDFTLKVPETYGGINMNISMLSPCETDFLLFDKLSFYTATSRGGRIINNRTNERLQQINMINEGAILNNSIQGSIRELNDMGKYLRYGKSFFIPISKNYLP